MKTNHFSLLAAMFLSLFLFACGGSGEITSGNLPSTGVGGGPIIPIGDAGTATVGGIELKFGNGSTTLTMVASTSSFTLLRATVFDTDGNPIPGKEVFFGTRAGGAFLPSNTVLTGSIDGGTDSSERIGLAPVNFFAPATLGTAELYASADGITSDTIIATFISGPPANIRFAAAPRLVQPTGTATIDVQISDANGLPSADTTVNFGFDREDSGFPRIDFFKQTDNFGQATVEYQAGSAGGTQLSPFIDTIRIAVGSTLFTTVDIAVASDAVVVSDLNLTGANSVVVGNSVGITATIIVAGGNPELIPVTFSLSDPSLGDLNGGVGDVTVDTSTSGESTVVFNAGTNVGVVEVSATASGFTKKLLIDLTAGAPANLNLTVAPDPVSVASPTNQNQADVIATVTDANGNPVPGERVNFNIYFADNETGGTVNASATTNMAGIARGVYTAGGTPGIDTITAETTSAAIISTTTVTALPDAAKVASIQIAADQAVLPTSTTANLIITALDSSGAPVPGVTLTVANTGSANLTGTTVTSLLGEVTMTLTDAVAEDVTVTVTAGSLAVQKQFFFGPSLEFVPDAVSGVGEVILTVRLLNGAGIPIADAPINFPIITVNDEFTDQLDFTTKANGTAQVRVTDPATAGVVVISANSGGVNSTTDATITFQTEAGSFSLTAVADNSVISTLGNTDVIATITNNADGTPFGGVSLNVLTTGSAVPTLTTGITDAFGRFKFNVSDPSDEDIIVTIHTDSEDLTVDLPLYFGAGMQLFPPTATGVADGVTTTELQAIVRSSAGAGIPSVPVDFAVINGSAIISGSRIITDANGVARVNATNSVIESNAEVQSTVGTAIQDSSIISFIAGTPVNITLTRNVVPPIDPTQITLFATTTFDAEVSDILGNPVSDNTAVTFTTTGGSITPAVQTSSGTATALFDAGTVSGLYTVTAEAGGISATFDIEVLALESGTIKVLSVTPDTVQVLGTSGEQTSSIRFLVQDAAGNPVDGELVTIFLDPKQLGGGESLSSGGAFSTSVIATTTNGIAEVTVRTGSVAGTLDITAQVDPDDPDVVDGDEFSTVAQVTIVGGVADGAHFSLAAETLNLAGGLRANLPSTVTAIVADRFSNIVPDGTNISFESECGRIGESAGFTSSTEQGLATAVFRTSNPMLTATGGLEGPVPFGQTGFCRILAYTTGDESYYDANGNGVFDAGDTCTGDLSEPFIDANDSGTHEAGELYIDIDSNGSFDVADGTCNSDTTIWTSMTLLMSSYADLVVEREEPKGSNLWVADLPADLAINESQRYRAIYSDQFGNALIPGTTFLVEKIQGNGGLLTGTTSLSLAGSAGTLYFTVRSDIDPDAEAELLELKVTLGPSGEILTDAVTGDEHPNNNGPLQYYQFVVNINQSPLVPLDVLWTVPSDGATNISDITSVTIAFTEAMNPLTATQANIQTECPAGTPYIFDTITASGDDSEFTLEHAAGSTFPAATTCTVTVSTGVRAADGTPLPAPVSFDFTTP